MKKTLPKLLATALALAVLLSLTACAKKPETPLSKTALFLQSQVKEPTFGALGGDWVVFGLARSGEDVSQKYLDTYYKNVVNYVEEAGGVLSDRKYTEYSRVVLALTAIGKDPRDVAGYDLLLPLADLDAVVSQGLNGAIFALLALDSGRYDIPENPDAATQATRELYVEEILRREIETGGWALSGNEPDADLTAMALQALSKYRENPDVSAAVERGITALADLQEPNGAYLSWGEENSESVSQVITALTELGLSPEDSRFVKNGQTLASVLEWFSCEDGGYRHTLTGEADEMATEQAFYALAAIHRAEAGLSTLYDMTDVMQ